MTRVTPHQYDVDLSPLCGIRVHGEPLEVLASALYRLRPTSVRNGMTRLAATFPADEAASIARAAMRIEARLLLDDADHVASGQSEGRTPERRRSDALNLLWKRVITAATERCDTERTSGSQPVDSEVDSIEG